MKVIVFHSSLDEVGGGEIVAYYLAKALNTRVYSIISDEKLNSLGFIDITPNLPFIAKIFRKSRIFN